MEKVDVYLAPITRKQATSDVSNSDKKHMSRIITIGQMLQHKLDVHQTRVRLCRFSDPQEAHLSVCFGEATYTLTLLISCDKRSIAG